VISLRHDGVKIKNLSYFERFTPYLMKTKKDALVYYTQTVPADALLDYIKAKNSDSGKKTISVLSIILSAMIRLAPEFSQIGTFLVGKRFYRREDITFSFVMKSSFEGPGKTALVKVRFSGKEKLYDVVDIIDTYKERVKKLSEIPQNHQTIY